ncbi:MAG: hypothetical protein K2W92_01885 [Alphaproteobacteria bacterium]|nr:hypothetical protein [Alphaproteobacteria bacterium]
MKKVLEDSFKEILASHSLTVERFDLTTAKEEFESYERVELSYFLFHLHTTRELCKGCAASFAAELRSYFLFQELLSHTKTSFLVSCSQILEGGDTNIRPSGIGKNQTSEGVYFPRQDAEEEKVLNFTPEENRNIVFQKILTDDSSQLEQEDDEALTIFD